MSDDMSIADFTAKYDAIIKSKWRLMEEVDCLPSKEEILRDFKEKALRAFQQALNKIEKNNKELSVCLFLFAQCKDATVSIKAGSPDGTPINLAEWNLVFSTLEPNAVKGIVLSICHTVDSTFTGVLEATAKTILAHNSVDTPIEIWEKLPSIVKEREENRICPKCRQRGTCRPLEIGYNKYAVICSECEYEGPTEITHYDAIDAFVKGFHKAFLKARKEERFDILSQKQVEIISDALEEIKKLKSNRACYCDATTIETIKKNILQKVNELL